MKRVVIDIETNGLLEDMIDYSQPYPLKLKDTARLWCISLRDFDNWEIKHTLSLEDCTKDNLRSLLSEAKEIIFHNGLNFDMPALQLFDVIEYTVGFPGTSDTCFGKDVKYIDTLLLSQFLKPDRLGGHSAKAWGRYLGDAKIDFHEFHQYSDEMVIYCEQDTYVQCGIYKALLEELVHPDELYKELLSPFSMESKLVDLVMRQELRGFKFDVPHAEATLAKFIALLDDLQSKIDPELPLRPLNKGEQAYYTPTAKQIKKNGEPTTHMVNFVAKIGAELRDDGDDGWTMIYEKVEYKLPYNEILKTQLPGSIHNLDYLKGYLLDLGWDPLEWKERDLTQDSKKFKLSDVKKEEAIHRYVTTTLDGPYKEHRLAIIGVKEGQLLTYLLSKKDERVLKVPTGPCLRVGTEKALCPNLEALGEEAKFVTHVVEYLTFKHRRSSLAGGVEDEDGEPTKGFLAYVREDGRISTPAFTCGANGGRFKHRVVNH